MTIDIRRAPADFQDWQGLLALIHAAFAYQHDRIDPPSSLHRMDVEAIAQKARDETLLLAFEGPALLGCVFARVQTDCVYIGKFAVKPARQSMGIGQRLMGAAEDLARERGLAALELETRIELTENHQTFAAMGFVKTAEHAHAGYDRPTSITMRKALR